ncbi:MAG: hypothetical protein L6420_10525 [Elusimicrobia bacterium]|nr:hypothetical protein [Elusimicrobiota bacterium]
MGLDEKTFDNYFKNAAEFPCLDRNGKNGRFFFDENKLKEWKEGFEWRTIDLTKDDYALCLDFALAQHFRRYVLSDWGTARQREFGQKITNWVKGQLAEVAVKKFFKKEFGIDVELDFRIYEEIVPQDIIGVIEDGKKREPKIGIGIKSSKPKSAFLILSENEVDLRERRSDIYIFCRPDIPDDHLLRVTREKIIEIVKDKQHFSSYKEDIPKFTSVPCEVAGWCNIDELEKSEANKIPGLEDATGYRYIKKSGQLHKDKKSWQELLSRL